MMLRRLAYVAFAVCGLHALRGMMRLHPGTAQARARQQALVFCAVSSGLPVLAVWLLSQLKPAYSTRYLLVFLPGYCMMVAAGLQMLPWKTARLMVVIVLVSTLLVGDWRTWRVEQNTDWRGVADYVVTRAQTGDVVLFSPRWNVKPFEYYSRERVDTNMDLPIPVTAQAAESVVRELSKSYQRVWFVWDEGHYSDVSGIAKQVLEEQYTAMTDVRFRGVAHVLLYVRRPGRIS
jgi:hypothetical protein